MPRAISRLTHRPFLARAARADLSELTLGKGVDLEFHMGTDNLMEFKVHVMPDDGMYRGGRFTFDFKVSSNYPHDPPKVLCETTVRRARRARRARAPPRGRAPRQLGRRARSPARSCRARPRVASAVRARDAQVYHPNIDMEGHVCLNILREDWKPVLTINSVIYGLTFLMLEPNADDPLNKEAATLLETNRKQFEQIVRRTLRGGQMKVGAQMYAFTSLVRD